MTNVKFKISPPWILYVSKINALFANDPDITVEYDNDEIEVKLFVDDNKKATALDFLLPPCVEFGNIILNITIFPSNVNISTINTYNLNTIQDYFEAAFKGNPVFAFTHVVEGIFSNKLTYVVFKNRVVQFFADNLNDIYGNISTLYQELASEVFNTDALPGVLFCTDVEERVGKPLGEWP